MELNFDNIEIDLKIFNDNYNSNTNDNFDKELLKFRREIKNNLEKSCIKFEYGEIIDKTTIEFILGNKDTFIPESNKYTLITKILQSEYEFYYAIIPYNIDDNNKIIVNDVKINDLNGVITNIKPNEYYSKDEIINLIINNKLMIGISYHFSNPEGLCDIDYSSVFEEIVDYYKDPKNFKQRWIQYDYLETIQ